MPRRSRQPRTLLLEVLLLLGVFFLTCAANVDAAPAAPATPVTVVKIGDASVTHDADAAVWTIAAGGTTLSMRLGPLFDFQTLGLVTANQHQWVATAGADTRVILNGVSAPLGSTADGTEYESAQAVRQGSGVRLDASFLAAGYTVRVTRHYLAMSGSPSFEVWTTFQSVSGVPVTVSNIGALHLSVPNGTVRWLTGLQGDNADIEHDSAFTATTRALASGGSLALGSTRRCSETTVPWFMIDGSPDEFYAALLWSGAWSLNVTRQDTTLTIDVGLAPMQTSVGAPSVDGPHLLFGVARGGVAQATAAVRAYVTPGLRNGRPLSPLVTYNTWFAYGTQVDQASMFSEMDRVAALGTELFVVDAGWYTGAGASGPFDFDAGLGSWQVDATRFPDGLQALTAHAHQLGMKFGVWVEPERVNLSTVGAPGLADESWLATTGGTYGDAQTALICLGGSHGRQWLQQQLFALIDQVQPDYLKWDNNLWVNCDRAGHDHGAGDGNFAQINGLYQVLAAVRARYPQLLVENVASGGNRLDLGMLRYTDAAWMDDRTAPSVHVRHNTEGLSQLFPPAYLLSFLTDNSAEPLHSAPDLPLYARSRMAGVFGLCFRSDVLTSEDSAALAREVTLYKTVRAAQTTATGILLTGQAKSTAGPVWDVLQETSAPSFMVFAFQEDVGTKKLTVKPSGLTATANYDVRTIEGTLLGTFRGSVLSSTGVDVSSVTSAAQVLVIALKQ